MVEELPKYSDSKLYLKSFKEGDETRYYQFLWTIDNYRKVEINKSYVCHCISIGGEYHYLKLMRYPTTYYSASDNPNRARTELKLELFPKSVNVVFGMKEDCSNSRSLEEMPFCTPNGHLEIICDFNLSRKCGIFPDLYIPLLDTEQTFKVYKHMDEMFSSKQFCDLTISVDEKLFNVHKAVLANRSKVFASMLEANMKEKAENKIVIEDCESGIFDEFLRYVYSNTLNLTSVKSAVELYKLSEKYDLPDLKLDSSVFLARNLNADNVIQMLKFADLHEDTKLKEATMDYIFRNLLEVMESPDWSIFSSSTTDVDNLLSILGKYLSEKKLFDDFRPLKN